MLGGVLFVRRTVFGVVRNRTMRMSARCPDAMHRTRMQRRRLGEAEGEPQREQRGEGATQQTAHGTNIWASTPLAYNSLAHGWRVTIVTGRVTTRMGNSPYGVTVLLSDESR